MDLTNFKVVFSVDFVHLNIHLSSPTQAKWISRITGLSVDPLNKENTQFRVKVQDVENYEQLENVFNSIQKSPECRAFVEKYEVSMDLRFKPNQRYNRHLLAQALTHLIRHIDPVEPNNARWTYPVRKFGGTISDVTSNFSEGHHLAIGNRTLGPVYQAAYLKTSNNSGKEQLPEHLHSARFEVRYVFPREMPLEQFKFFDISSTVKEHFKLWGIAPTSRQQEKASLHTTRLATRLDPHFDDHSQKSLKRLADKFMPKDVPRSHYSDQF